MLSHFFYYSLSIYMSSYILLPCCIVLYYFCMSLCWSVFTPLLFRERFCLYLFTFIGVRIYLLNRLCSFRLTVTYMTGNTTGTRTDYPSRTPEFTTGFNGVIVDHFFYYLHNVLSTIVFRFDYLFCCFLLLLFFFVFFLWSLYYLSLQSFTAYYFPFWYFSSFFLAPFLTFKALFGPL